MVRFVWIGALVLIAGLFPSAVFAQAVQGGKHAICTQVEPNFQQNGISFYGGQRYCTLIAATQGDWGYASVPFDPELPNINPMCGWYVTGDHQEYAIAWAFTGFDGLAARVCYSMREGGVPVIFFNHAWGY